MKHFPVFMIILCLISLADPCCGKEVRCVEEAKNPPSEHHKSPEPCDSAPCSSFFTCGNCPGFILDEENSAGTRAFFFSAQKTPRVNKVTEHSGYVMGLKRPPKR